MISPSLYLELLYKNSLDAKDSATLRPGVHGPLAKMDPLFSSQILLTIYLFIFIYYYFRFLKINIVQIKIKIW